MASRRNGIGIIPAADFDRVKTSFTVAMAYSVLVGTTVCEFPDKI